MTIFSSMASFYNLENRIGKACLSLILRIVFEVIIRYFEERTPILSYALSKFIDILFLR